VKREANFAKDFGLVAKLCWCNLEIVPDFIPLKRYGKIVAHRLPFDAVLITSHKVYCIEFKYQYGKLIDHQERTGQRINRINQCYYVVRKKVNKKMQPIYTIETEGKEIIFKKHLPRSRH